MEHNEKVNAAKKIHERARYYRGRFLNSVAVIERDIAMILTDYFCTKDEEKRELFFRNIATAPSFSLKTKKDILVKIVKKDYPIYWDNNSDVLRHFEEIIEFRNKLAHSIVDVSDEALKRPIEDGIGFVEWQEGKPITQEDFDDLDAWATTVNSCLNDIRRLLPYKQTRATQK